ncbi:Polyribonucleotide nucleotidyltransferase, RNA binding domain [Musa troglodytarum]|uniref:polyribonucleotide nucleotidyltransferase n=1 Tax=Musa troglodytarum TaxID=320322 RepID=A0A9E7I870_9LILI|nr:Polyribonucleotide nucleotidyltransferase, RNA binding domain [Musa troglodytarum]
MELAAVAATLRRRANPRILMASLLSFHCRQRCRRLGLRFLCSDRHAFVSQPPPPAPPERAAESFRTRKVLETFREDFEVGSRTISIETGKIARFANGSVVINMGDTNVLSTVASARGDGARDFLPLTVMVNVLSSDGKQDPDVMAANATSAAMMLSDIPWNGPIGLSLSDLNLVYACTTDRTLMIDVQAREISEKDLEAGLKLAHLEAVKYIEPQIRLAEKAGKRKKEYKLSMISDGTLEKIRNLAEAPIQVVFTDSAYGKFERGEALDKITQTVKAKLEEECDEESLKVLPKAIDTVRKQIIRRRIIDEGLRVDGRKLDEVRPLYCESGTYPSLHGSSLFSRGDTQVLCTVTLGAPGDAQRLDSIVGPPTKRFMLHYSFPPFSINEVGKRGGLNRREVGHGTLAEKALLAVLPPEADFPYTVRVNSEVMASDGSTSMATVCGGKCGTEGNRAHLCPLSMIRLKPSWAPRPVGNLILCNLTLVNDLISTYCLHNLRGYALGDLASPPSVSSTTLVHNPRGCALGDLTLVGGFTSIRCMTRVAAPLVTSHRRPRSWASICVPLADPSPRLMALMDAGIPVRVHVAGVSVGLVSDVDPSTGRIINYRILTDILGLEDHLGDMDFKIAGTRKGITAIQLDIKPAGIPLDIICECLEPAQKGRNQILDRMEEEISAPHTLGDGSTPRLDIEFSSEYFLTLEGESQWSTFVGPVISFLIGREIEVGGIYKGVVSSVKEYGAFVEFNGGQQGLLHISELSHETDVRGNIKLSLKATIPKQDSLNDNLDGQASVVPANQAANVLDGQASVVPANQAATVLDGQASVVPANQAVNVWASPSLENTTCMENLGSSNDLQDESNELQSATCSSPAVVIRSAAECDAQDLAAGKQITTKRRKLSKSSPRPYNASLPHQDGGESPKNRDDVSLKKRRQTKKQKEMDAISGTKQKSDSTLKTVSLASDVDEKPKPRICADSLKLGDTVTAKVYQIRARGLVLELNGGIRGMFKFEVNGRRDFEVGKELLVRCSSFSSKGIPVFSLLEDE